MALKQSNTLSRIQHSCMGRIRSSRKQHKIGRGYKGIYSSLVFAALRAAVPRRKVDKKWFRPVSCRKVSNPAKGPQNKTDRVEGHPSLIMRKTVDQRDTTREKLDGFNPNVTIGTMGAHYWIRILTYKKYTPLSNYLATFEVDNMEVMNLTMFTSINNVFYSIILEASVKSKLEIDLLRDRLQRLASTKCEPN